MNNEWETPDDLYEILNNEFQFDFDLCANAGNARCDKYSTDVESVNPSDGARFFMNPPYSRGKIGMAMRKAVDLFIHHNKIVVCLVRFDPSAKWFQEFVHNYASQVRMLSSRVRFKGAKSAYNFPCCVVVYQDAPMVMFRRGQLIGASYLLWSWK